MNDGLVIADSVMAVTQSDACSLLRNLTKKRIESGLLLGNFSGDDGNLYASLDASGIIGTEDELNF